MAAPGWPEAAEEVGRLGMLVAVDDVQTLASECSSQLTHRCLACTRLTHQQRRLRVLQAAAEQGVHAAHGRRPHNAIQSATQGCCGVGAIGSGQCGVQGSQRSVTLQLVHSLHVQLSPCTRNRLSHGGNRMHYDYLGICVSELEHESLQQFTRPHVAVALNVESTSFNARQVPSPSHLTLLPLLLP